MTSKTQLNSHIGDPRNLKHAAMPSEGYSYETGKIPTFHAADYAVFGCTLGISAAIGVFYAIKDRNKQTTDDYLLAGRSMHPIPVAMSLLSSFISAITILGTPAEVYVYSTMYWWISVAFIITAIGAGHIFIPIFYNLGITSVFQYAEMRFGHPTRVLASITYLVWMGGMKAVLWADTLQMMIVYGGMITMVAMGANLLGGIDEVWRTADEHGRIVFFEFNTDPRMRHSVWTVVFGGAVFWCCVFGTNQAQVQRAISVSSITRAKLAIWLNLPGMASIITISCLVGLVIFSFYAKARCDPVSFGIISKADQLVPLYTMDIMNEYHGLPGLLLSTIFSGSLSTISSGLNAVAAVMLEDFVKPMCCKGISPFRATIMSKIFVIVFGFVSLAFAFLVSQLGTMILTLAYVLFGVLGGPLLGMFSLGMLFPWANKWGGGIGLATSLALLLWIGLGQSITGTSVVIKPPVETVGCNWNATGFSRAETPINVTAAPGHTTTIDFAHPVTSAFDKYTGIERLYTVSYLWYSPIAVLVCVVVGLFVSLITGIEDTKKLNPKLICPAFDIFFPYLPEKIRKPLRFGVRHGEYLPEFDSLAERKERINSLTVNEAIPVVTANGSKAAGVDNRAYDPPQQTHL
ncbi:SC5A8-like protein [Mya arenaria]|uniref:SC5A8-like protein n=1 Tax=Mya arenaria TaxID=6604 RepID=A0ABY7DJG6_MYAAR|nr:SC5A8-like protein [Mya arenaria]